MTDIRKGKGKEEPFDADYDFASMDWGGADDGGKPSSPASDDGFGGDEFAAFAKGGEAPAFEDDPGEDFTFDSIPAPGASGVPGFGSAEDEFADVASGRSSERDSFAIEEDGSEEFDPSGDSSAFTRPAGGATFYEDEGEGGVFGPNADEDAGDETAGADDSEFGIDGQEVETPAPAPARSLMSRLAIPGALAVAGVAAFVGYSTLFPSTKTAPPVQVASNAPAGSVEFPTSLPGRSPAPAQPIERPSTQIPAPAAAVPGGAPALTLPELPGRAVQQPAIKTPVAPAVQLPDDDLVGGHRGGIAPSLIPPTDRKSVV